jgi:hypothetical protein
MKKLINRLINAKSVAIAVLAAVAALFLPVGAFREVTQELMAMFGLLMAGILPTMVLTASALRAGNLSVKKLTDYKAALARQMNVWIGLFIISLVASVVVIVGKMAGWSIPVSFPKLEKADLSVFDFDAIRIVNAMIAGAGALLVLRAFSLGRGIVSLLTLSSELALGEARLRDEERNKKVDAEVLEIAARPGFGDYVELKH